MPVHSEQNRTGYQNQQRPQAPSSISQPMIHSVPYQSQHMQDPLDRTGSAPLAAIQPMASNSFSSPLYQPRDSADITPSVSAVTSASHRITSNDRLLLCAGFRHYRTRLSTRHQQIPLSPCTLRSRLQAPLPIRSLRSRLRAFLIHQPVKHQS